MFTRISQTRPMRHAWRSASGARGSALPPSTSTAHFPPLIARRWQGIKFWNGFPCQSLRPVGHRASMVQKQLVDTSSSFWASGVASYTHPLPDPLRKCPSSDTHTPFYPRHLSRPFSFCPFSALCVGNSCFWHSPCFIEEHSTKCEDREPSPTEDSEVKRSGA